MLRFHLDMHKHVCVRADGDSLVIEIDDICLITNLFFTYD